MKEKKKYNNFSIKRIVKRLEKEEINEHYKMLKEKEKKLKTMGIDFNSGMSYSKINQTSKPN